MKLEKYMAYKSVSSGTKKIIKMFLWLRIRSHPKNAEKMFQIPVELLQKTRFHIWALCVRDMNNMVESLEKYAKISNHLGDKLGLG